MRGKVATELRQMVRSIYDGRPIATYEYKDFTHGGQVIAGTTCTLTHGCMKSLFKTAKRNWKDDDVLRYKD